MISMNPSKDNLSSSKIRCVSLLFSVRALLLVLVFVGAMSTYARAQKPKIAIFSGGPATIQNSQALVTSNKARKKYGLPLLSNPDGTPFRFDILRHQRLAAPVTVYVEALSAHPLEQDMAELYAPPDGYVSAETGTFSKERQRPGDIRSTKSLFALRTGCTRSLIWLVRPMDKPGTDIVRPRGHLLRNVGCRSTQTHHASLRKSIALDSIATQGTTF